MKQRSSPNRKSASLIFLRTSVTKALVLWVFCWQILTIKEFRRTLHRLIVLMYICMQVWQQRSNCRVFNLLSLTFTLFYNHDFFDHRYRTGAVEIQALHGELAGQAMRTKAVKTIFWTRNMKGTTFSKTQIVLYHHLLTVLVSNTLKQKAVWVSWYMNGPWTFLEGMKAKTTPKYHIFSSQNIYFKHIYF